MSAASTLAHADEGIADSPLLTVQGLSKFYGPRVGCIEVGFDLYPGEVLAVVGEFGLGQIDPSRNALRPPCPLCGPHSLQDARRRDA